MVGLDGSELVRPVLTSVAPVDPVGVANGLTAPCPGEGGT